MAGLVGVAFLSVSGALAAAFLAVGPGRPAVRVLVLLLAAAAVGGTVGALQVPSSGQCRAVLEGFGLASAPGNFDLPCLDLLLGSVILELVLLDLGLLVSLIRTGSR